MRTFAAAYPWGLFRPRGISLGKSPNQARTFAERTRRCRRCRPPCRLDQVWVVTVAGPGPARPCPATAAALAGAPLYPIYTRRVEDI